MNRPRLAGAASRDQGGLVWFARKWHSGTVHRWDCDTASHDVGTHLAAINTGGPTPPTTTVVGGAVFRK